MKENLQTSKTKLQENYVLERGETAKHFRA